MPVPSPQRMDNLDIPERPALASESKGAMLARRPVMLYGGVAAAALLIFIVIASLRSGTEEVARAPADAPLIRAADGPIKVLPDTPGGMDVQNRDMRVYGRMQGKSAERGEHLQPYPEEPIEPPTPPRPAQTQSTAGASGTDLPWTEDKPADASAAPAVPEPSTRPLAESKGPPASGANAKAPVAPAPSPPPSSGTAAATTSSPSQPASARPARSAETKTALARPAPTTPKIPASDSGVELQLFSSRSAEEAKGAWTRLKEKNGDLLGPLSPSVARASLGDRGTFYRLRAGPIASEPRARAICDSLSARGVSCLVVRSSS